METSKKSPFLSMQETADRLGFNYYTVYNMIRSGRIPYIQHGRASRILIPREYVDGLVDQAYRSLKQDEGVNRE